MFTQISFEPMALLQTENSCLFCFFYCAFCDFRLIWRRLRNRVENRHLFRYWIWPQIILVFNSVLINLVLCETLLVIKRSSPQIWSMVWPEETLFSINKTAVKWKWLGDKHWNKHSQLKRDICEWRSILYALRAYIPTKENLVLQQD